MLRDLEKKFSARALELGNSGEGSSLPELTQLLLSESAEVRRLAISAISKLAGVADPAQAVTAALPLLRDPHPQVRQYAIKALSAYGISAEPARHDLEDIAANPAEKDYNRRDANKALATLKEALRIAEAQAIHCCQRCQVRIDADEYARSRRAFDRPYCDRCFDEVYLRRRNEDTRIELHKTIQARDGTLVQSHGERLIAEWLSQNNIPYRYDERIRILKGYAIRPDFYLPEFDLYIEYWGMDTADYKIGMLMKQQIYQQEGKALISLYPEDKEHIGAILSAKLFRRHAAQRSQP